METNDSTTLGPDEQFDFDDYDLGEEYELWDESLLNGEEWWEQFDKDFGETNGR